MDACCAIIASAVVLGAGVWFVSWCLRDAVSDARWWHDHDDD